jgi:hypothetical protein
MNEHYTSDDIQKAKDFLTADLQGNNYIMVPLTYVHLCDGNWDMAVLLRQIAYWTGYYTQKGRRDGWFYKTYDEWARDTGIKESRVRRAIRGSSRRDSRMVTLQMLGVETKIKKANGAPTVHYRIDLNRFAMIYYAYHEALEANDRNPVNPIPIVDSVDNGSFAMHRIEPLQCTETIEPLQCTDSITKNTQRKTTTIGEDKTSQPETPDQPTELGRYPAPEPKYRHPVDVRGKRSPFGTGEMARSGENRTLVRAECHNSNDLHSMETLIPEQRRVLHSIYGSFFKAGPKLADDLRDIESEYRLGTSDSVWNVYIALRQVFGRDAMTMTQPEVKAWMASAVELWRADVKADDLPGLYAFVKKLAEAWSDEYQSRWTHRALVTRVSDWRAEQAKRTYKTKRVIVPLEQPSDQDAQPIDTSTVRPTWEKEV